MIRRLQEVTVPEVGRANEAEIARFLGQMTQESIPAFVIQDAGPNLHAVTDGLRPLLSAYQYSLELDEEPMEMMRIPLGATHTVGEIGLHPRDVGPHSDSIPGDSLAYVLHLTTTGEAEADFFEPTPEYCEERMYGRLPYPQRALLSQDKVDDTVFKPTRHHAKLRAGSLVVFRVSGEAPLVHDFRTLVAPRLAEVTRIKPQTPKAA